MTRIRPATEADAALLAPLADRTFRESHGHSAPPADIEAYSATRLSEEVLLEELRDAANRYHLLYADDTVVGFSRVVFDTPCPGIDLAPVAKLDRLYVLTAHLGRGLGAELFHFLVADARNAGQKGMWLYVWIENERALRFYRREGFEEVGRYDFVVSPTHSNPNYRMLLRF